MGTRGTFIRPFLRIVSELSICSKTLLLHHYVTGGSATTTSASVSSKQYMNANYNTAVRNWAYPVGVNAAFLTPRLSIKVSMTPRFLCQSYQEMEVPPPGTFYCNMECPYVGYLFSIVEYCRGESIFRGALFRMPRELHVSPVVSFLLRRRVGEVCDEDKYQQLRARGRVPVRIQLYFYS